MTPLRSVRSRPPDHRADHAGGACRHRLPRGAHGSIRGGQGQQLALPSRARSRTHASGGSDHAGLAQRRKARGEEPEDSRTPQGRLLLRLPNSLRPADEERKPAYRPRGAIDRALPGGSLLAVCRVYAPMYRQVTLTADRRNQGASTACDAIAYNSVLDAWNKYLTKYNDGRGMVFIGHSQGILHPSRVDRQRDRHEQPSCVTAWSPRSFSAAT